MPTFEERRAADAAREEKLDHILTVVHGLFANTHVMVIDKAHDQAPTRVWFEQR